MKLLRMYFFPYANITQNFNQRLNLVIECGDLQISLLFSKCGNRKLTCIRVDMDIHLSDAEKVFIIHGAEEGMRADGRR